MSEEQKIVGIVKTLVVMPNNENRDLMKLEILVSSLDKQDIKILDALFKDKVKPARVEITKDSFVIKRKEAE